MAKSKRKKKWDRKVKSIKLSCSNDMDKCGRLIPEENMTCVSMCMSTKCHEEIFAANPLEDGEVDYQRWTAFEKCVREELKIKL